MNTSKTSRNRIRELDALRGIALFGILLVNIFVFHAPYSYYGEFYGAFEGIQATVVEAVVDFAGGKFLFIFAFLFGYGIALQKESNGDAFRSYHSKRMFVLLLFGLTHIVLFWFGDILASYALLGLLLLPIIRLPDRYILFAALFFLLFRPLYYFALVVFDWPLIDMGKAAPLEQFVSTFQEGSFYEIFLLRMKELSAFMPENLVWYIPKTFGLFLIGFYARNKRLTVQIKEKTGKYRWLFFSLLAISIVWIFLKYDVFALFDLEATPMARPFLIAINVLVETAQGMAYIIGFLLLFQKHLMLSKLFEATGRMALSNYILQSLVAVLIFYSYGFAAYSKLVPTDLLWISIAIYGFNIGFSQLYLKHHHYGPLEYLWRKSIDRKTASNRK